MRTSTAPKKRRIVNLNAIGLRTAISKWRALTSERGALVFAGIILATCLMYTEWRKRRQARQQSKPGHLSDNAGFNL